MPKTNFKTQWNHFDDKTVSEIDSVDLLKQQLQKGRKQVCADTPMQKQPPHPSQPVLLLYRTKETSICTEVSRTDTVIRRASREKAGGDDCSVM